MISLLLFSSLAFATPNFSSAGQNLAVSDLNDSFFASVPEFVWANDPFLKLSGVREKDAAAETYTVQAVMPDGSDSYAVVDGRVVRSGQKVRARKVRKIGENHVVLESDAGSMLEVPFSVRVPASVGGSAPASKHSGPSSIKIEEVIP